MEVDSASKLLYSVGLLKQLELEGTLMIMQDVSLQVGRQLSYP